MHLVFCWPKVACQSAVPDRPAIRTDTNILITVQLTSWVVIGNSASKHDGNAKENVCYKTGFPCFKLLHDTVTV